VEARDVAYATRFIAAPERGEAVQSYLTLSLSFQ
jgi:hypothetical protein